MFKVQGFVAVVLIFALSLFADISVTQKIGGADTPTNNEVMPHIQIINNNSTVLNLSDVVLEYFIYEPELSVNTLSWRNDWCKVGTNTNATSAYTVSFSRLDSAYTEGDKRADIKVTLSFTEGYALAPTEMAEIHFAFYRNDWQHNFNEVAHWSWKNSSTFVDADSTVIRSVDENNCLDEGCISRGVEPPLARADLYVYPEECGASENMKFDGTIKSGNFEANSSLMKIGYYWPGTQYYPSGKTIKTEINMLGISIKHFTMDGFFETSLSAKGVATDAVKCKTAEVNGLLKAKEIRVTSNGWADYVFKDDYKLKTLSETEKFINQNGHLPNIPSAAEVEKDGVSIGDMQTKLLAKVEELTLHMISLSKKNSELEDKIKVLSAKGSN